MNIYQAFLGDAQRVRVSAHAIPYEIEQNTGSNAREYELFQKIHATTPPDAEPWGLVSWKFEHKCRIPLACFKHFAQEQFDAGADAVFINPMIVRQSEEVDIQKEGCLSFPDTVSIPVRRSLKVTVSAFDHNGAAFIADLEGLAARVVLHEVDHLQGRTVLDHASPAQKKKAMLAIAKALQVKVGRK